jgi:hypothetical protein
MDQWLVHKLPMKSAAPSPRSAARARNTTLSSGSRKGIFTRHDWIINTIMAKLDGLAEQSMAADEKQHEQIMVADIVLL